MLPVQLKLESLNEIHLGEAILFALSRSLEFIPSDAKAQFEAFVAERGYDEYVELLVKLGGFKNRREMFREMRRVNVTRVNDILRFVPTKQTKSEEWQGLAASDVVVIEGNASASVVGAAGLLALSRCVVRS